MQPSRSFLESITWWRQREAAARFELKTCTDPDTRLYLTARANQADCEAGAMERYVRSLLDA